MYILLEVGVNVLVVFLRLIVVDERDALGCACHLVSAVGGAVYGNVVGSLFLAVGDGDGSICDVAVVVVGVHSCHGLAALHVGSHYNSHTIVVDFHTREESANLEVACYGIGAWHNSGSLRVAKETVVEVDDEVVSLARHSASLGVVFSIVEVEYHVASLRVHEVAVIVSNTAMERCVDVCRNLRIDIRASR